MATTIEDVQRDIEIASEPNFRGRLLSRGQARAIIWRNGVLPPDAPAFSNLLSYDLHSYGYAMLGLALRLRDLDGNANVARVAFERAATALESVIAKGDPQDPDRAFHHVVAASAYHLGQFSARAYSLLARMQVDERFSRIERALCQLMLRNLDSLEELVLSSRLHGAGSDATIREYFEATWGANAEDVPQADDDDESFVLEGLYTALEDNFFAAIAMFLFALERGEHSYVEQSIERLRKGITACAELNLLPQWWAHRLSISLLDDLWSSSFHEQLPRAGPTIGDAAAWDQLRERFIAVLLRRGKSEIDVWPSQRTAAVRAINQEDDLVVSLPTSAGKTRIAELCILRCLAAGRRVVFVTPLRALSAQTELSLQRTFAPLGQTVSALYGSIGVSGFDVDAIRQRNIVVATPEKLDFALRSDPTLIDDVGLFVFDEGHMIGLGEREVRYEVQIQRLLKRPDANQRRIVCLSAILPEGEQLDDFANWLRRDQPGGLVKSDWRPTRLRYGEILWNGDAGRLNFRVGEERPFVPKFITAHVPPIGKRTRPFPKDLGELCLATAWRLVEDGQTVLVFCPVRAHVEPFANRVVDLHRRGALPALLEAGTDVLATALILGEEWLGAGHPILQCLSIGVAIHHAALPTAFRKEIERLLREGVLKVTISSPTLAQGLNLSATAVIIHSLFRNQERIPASEFTNVVGRAGRAFVDMEGLVIYPIFDKHAKRLEDWESLLADAGARHLESGLLRLVFTLTVRMYRMLGQPSLPELAEYVLNNTAAWEFPTIPGEGAKERERESARWNGFLASLDTAILSLLGDRDIQEEHIAEMLDDILSSSLWERRLSRRSEDYRAVLKAGLLSRARFIWARASGRQRKGYFLAGVGLSTGQALDGMAAECNALLVNANASILNGEGDAAIEAISTLAERVFKVPPFVPENLPDNWREILNLWLSGSPVATAVVGQEADALQFVEGGLVYRLPWALEAIRVRAVANGDTLDEQGTILEDVDLGVAIAALETGTLNRAAALLMKAGFTSRSAAIKAVQEAGGNFSSVFELRQWLNSEQVVVLTGQDNWPTPETASMWRIFRSTFSPADSAVWIERQFAFPVAWFGEGNPPPTGTPLRLYSDPASAEHLVLSDSGERLGRLDAPINPQRIGLCRTSVSEGGYGAILSYLGPDDLLAQ